MRKRNLPGVEQVAAQNHRRRIWQRVVGMLACVVVFVTTYALILPAITMETPALCGKEEHSHIEECFDAEDTSVLTCALEEHSHSDECRKTAETTAPEETGAAAETFALETLPDTQETEPAADIVISGEGEAPEAMDGPLPEEIFVEETALAETGLTWKITVNSLNEYTLWFDGEGAIPDYANTSELPWTDHRSKICKVVFGDKVTRVGNVALAGVEVKEITWGGVTTVGTNAFLDCEMTSLTIPGSVKTIESKAFAENSFTNGLVLGDGIETIGDEAFSGLSGTDVYIPASVTSIGTNALSGARTFTVHEDNPNYMAEGGILFGRRKSTTEEDTGTEGSGEESQYDKRKEVLIRYPNGLTDVKEYTIPEEVRELAWGAFRYNRTLRKLTIPKTVTNFNSHLFNGSSIEEIYFENETAISSDKMYFWFNGMTNLRTIHFPENVPVTLGGLCVYHGDLSRLESINFPNEMTSLAKFAWNITCPALRNVLYDARDSAIEDTDLILGWGTQCEVTVGPSVDKLPAGFACFSRHTSAFYFAPGNILEAAEGAFNGFGAPLEGVSGMLYADANGVLYAYDPKAATASLVYCPPDVTAVTVPAAITVPVSVNSSEETVSCSVVLVRGEALKYAEMLESITFEDPSLIKTLETYALANCTTLMKVIGGETVAETVADATALFGNAEFGYNVFHNTGLGGSSSYASFGTDMNGKKSLLISQNTSKMEITITSSGETVQWKEKTEGTGVGGYQFLTGDPAVVNITIGNTDGDNTGVYRVYFQFTGEQGSLSIAPGTEYTFEGQPAVCYATEDPNTYCLEFTPKEGMTANIPVNAVYASPDTAGGGLTVWGVILPDAGESALRKLVESTEGTIQLFWDTQTDPFALSIELGDWRVTSSEIGVNSNGPARGIFNYDIVFWLHLGRTEDTASTYGKEYAASADFTAYLDLPTGVSWAPEVVQAIKDGNTSMRSNILYAGDIQVGAMSSSNNNIRLTNMHLRWDEAQNGVVLHWRVANKTDTEMATNAVSFAVYKDGLMVDTAVFSAQFGDDEESKPLTCRFEAVMNYAYGAKEKLNIEQTVNILKGAPRIVVGKDVLYPKHFGEGYCDTITFANQGSVDWVATDTAVKYVYEILPVVTYVTPENMQKMFQEEHGETLTVEIKNATLGQWQAVMGIDGKTTAWRHPGNSNIGTAGYTLYVNRKDTTVDDVTTTEYTVTVKDGGIFTGATVAEALQNAGYGVTQETVYTCRWAQSDGETPCRITAGTNKTFHVYANIKDTFQTVTTDWDGYYQRETVDVYYYAYFSGGGSSWYNPCTFYREAGIGKHIERDGTILEGNFSVEHGDVLTHQIDLTHYGSGVYQNLPMVDDIYGSQCLLVPIAENPGLADKGLPTHGDDYILNQVGTYENVYVGVDLDDESKYLNAATVTVSTLGEEEKVGDAVSYGGIHTQIKWYFPEIPGGNYLKSIRYQTLVDLEMTDSAYTIGTTAWANDKSGSRLYTSVWGGGSFIGHDKDIVLEMGETPDQDKLADYSVVKAGEQVTYRVTLRSTEAGTFNLSGVNLADNLPDTFDLFTWERGKNISDIRVEVEGDGISYTEELKTAWYVGDSYGGFLGEDERYILWPETASITFTKPGTIYLYYTLTYPADTEAGDLWNKYVGAVHGNRIDNTLYVYRYPEKVEHDLWEVGNVVLQKGVAGTYIMTYRMFPGNSRVYYNCQDSAVRRILYYVTLYNGGNKRLYLNDMQDKLPAGFTFSTHMASSAHVFEEDKWLQGNIITTVGGTDLGENPLTQIGLPEGAPTAVFRSVTVKGTATDDGVLFTFDAGTGDYAISYDETRGQYYLNRNEAIVFGYIANIDTVENTEISATNTIAMPYEDYLDTGAKPVGTDKVKVAAGQSAYFRELNDGDRQVKSAQQIRDNYGFAVGEEENWLVSQVTSIRGGIAPGLTKYTDSYISSATGKTITYTNYAGPGDTVTWRIRVHNTGTMSMTDYTLTDILPAPYVLEGDIKYTIYAQPYNHDAVQVRSATLCTIPTGRTGGESSLRIGNRTVTFGQEMNMGSYSITMNRDDGNNECVTLRFTDKVLTIPECGYMDLYLTARNPTTDYVNRVYINRAMLTPNAQTFTAKDVANGNVVYEDGNAVGVESSAPMTVSFGYATSSEKQVATKADADGVVVSTDSERNVITLANREDLITYTLTVNNDTDNPMTKLVLIDTLPQPGDTSPFDQNVKRGSAFTVALAEDPNFTVCVNGTPTEIPCTVQFSSTSVIDEPQGDDWNGVADEKWNASAADARAVRIILTDDTGTLIPAKSTVSVSFDAKVSGDAQPGQVAWNSFGYHYGLKDVQTELEAMPLGAGVIIPEEPKLQKKLVDPEGNPVKASGDTTFSFLLYEGTALETTGELTEALKEAGRAYKTFDVTVEEGQTESAAVTLDWTWTTGAAYTIVELPVGEGYQTHSVGGSEGNSHTFQYAPSGMATIECVNILKHWAIQLTKTDASGSPLSGAVFALYSPAQADQIAVPAEYGDLEIPETITRETTDWYLAGVAESGEDGVILWDALLRGSYLLVEVKAPNGYMLSNTEGQLVYRSGTGGIVKELTVVNYSGYELPETGGMGTRLHTTAGLALICLSGVLGYFRKRRKAA